MRHREGELGRVAELQVELGGVAEFRVELGRVEDLRPSPSLRRRRLAPAIVSGSCSRGAEEISHEGGLGETDIPRTVDMMSFVIALYTTCGPHQRALQNPLRQQSQQPTLHMVRPRRSPRHAMQRNMLHKCQRLHFLSPLYHHPLLTLYLCLVRFPLPALPLEMTLQSHSTDDTLRLRLPLPRPLLVGLAIQLGHPSPRDLVIPLAIRQERFDTSQRLVLRERFARGLVS